MFELEIDVYRVEWSTLLMLLYEERDFAGMY
jgi:hypothetical protein